MSDDQADWAAGMRALEEALWRSETRGDPTWMESILAPHFVEHGRSGQIWSRQEIIDMTISGEIPVVLPLPDYQVRLVADTVAIATYRSIVDGAVGNRVSVWSHDGSHWQLEFHQGTPAATPPNSPDSEPG